MTHTAEQVLTWANDLRNDGGQALVVQMLESYAALLKARTEQLTYVQECIERAKLLPVWDNVPSSLHAELDNIFRGVAHLAQRQDTQPLSIPTEQGIYAWLNEYSAALVMVNKRPSDCSPGGVLNGHAMESTKFYDGCRVEYWTGGKWFGPLTAQPAQRPDSEQSRLMQADDTSPRIPQRPDSDRDGKSTQSIAEAVTYWNSKWPAELHSGVMFFKGQRITKEEFLNAAKGAKE